MPVALPPLAEQKRIVAKVAHLMAFCDELEAKLERSRETSGALMNAMLRAASKEREEAFPSVLEAA